LVALRERRLVPDIALERLLLLSFYAALHTLLTGRSVPRAWNHIALGLHHASGSAGRPVPRASSRTTVQYS
ncbi:hypothetical protein HAX54_045540, partial [Datura stramonium]|nr:hypothetical protein [Datura stramonium]